jgi:quinol monooxygenase YgiN
MAIGVVATLKVHEGKEAEFEGVFRELMDQVRAQEPGNHLYRLFHSRNDKSTYVVMEIYDDDDSLKAHRKSEHFRAISPKLGAVLAGAPDVHLMDAV